MQILQNMYTFKIEKFGQHLNYIILKMSSVLTRSYLQSARLQACDAGVKGGLVSGSGYHYERDHCDLEEDKPDEKPTTSDNEFIDDDEPEEFTDDEEDEDTAEETEDEQDDDEEFIDDDETTDDDK